MSILTQVLYALWLTAKFTFVNLRKFLAFPKNLCRLWPVDIFTPALQWNECVCVLCTWLGNRRNRWYVKTHWFIHSTPAVWDTLPFSVLKENIDCLGLTISKSWRYRIENFLGRPRLLKLNEGVIRVESHLLLNVTHLLVLRLSFPDLKIG